jgi:DNA-binding transcriptional LysR family regulator
VNAFMDVRHLHYFTEVAKHKNFTRASEALHISQPSLSKMVKSLEEELGTPLLDRSFKKVELTDAGAIVYEQAESIIASLRDLSNSLYDLMHLKRGIIKIGIPPIIGTLFFPPIIKSFREQYPDVQIQMIEYGAKKMEKIVEQGDVDVGVVLLPVNEDMFSFTPLAKETLQLIVHKNHPLARHKSISLQELKNETFISFHEDFTMYEMVYNECLKSGFEPTIGYKSSQWDFISEMVAANLGIALFPYSLCEKIDLEQLTVVELENGIPWELALITKQDRYISYATQAFIDHIKQTV